MMVGWRRNTQQAAGPAVTAVDATGKVWLDKRYKQRADDRAYGKSIDGGSRQPFQNLYHRIANDLAAARGKRKDRVIANIRTVSELKFAADLAPAAFSE